MSAPVALFAWKRPLLTKRAIDSLAACPSAGETDLSVFIDGPADTAERVLVDQVREVVSGVSGFRSVHCFPRERHLGLSASVLDGVGRVLEQADRVIVLEDDLLVQPAFLTYMNTALARFQDQTAVFSVCGYGNRVKTPAGFPSDTYFGPRSSSWGWATWRDRWATLDWNPSPEGLRGHACAFNAWGGSDCSRMLRHWMAGKNDSWAIRFGYNQFLQGKVSLFPIRSLVDPTPGFDGSGTHCRKYNRSRFLLDDRDPSRPFLFPDTPVVDPVIRRSVLRYHSIPARAWSRLMYLLYA